jgi:hypothetical protein
MSRKAIVRVLLDTIVAGMSVAAMPQNRQSGTGKILTCTGPATPLTYMVVYCEPTVRHPSGATASPVSGFPSLGVETCAGAVHRRKGVGEVELARRAGILPAIAKTRDDSG